MKMECRSKDAAARQMFGRRKVVPIVCIMDAKRHVRAFLKTDLDELGFVVCESSNIDELAAVVEARRPDIVVMGLSAGELELRETIKTLATKEFAGLVLPIGPPDSPENRKTGSVWPSCHRSPLHSTVTICARA
jgi:hypothetical protein